MKEYEVVVGIDWSESQNYYAFRVKGEEKVRQGSFAQSAEGIEKFVQELRKLSRGLKVAVALEQSRGPLIFALMKYDFIVLYPINPKSFAKYREAWTPSRAKDDPTDAKLILEMLEDSRGEKLRAWKPENPEVRLLQRLTEQRGKVLNDLKRTGNRLTSTLKEYFPQLLELFPVIYRDVVADFILLYPTLEDAKTASEQELLNFFRTHRSTNSKKNLERIKLLKESQPITNDMPVIKSNSLYSKSLANELRALNSAIAEYEKEIAIVYSKLPDRKIFDSLPSAGEISAPRLLVAVGVDRSKFDSAEELACFLGIAPVLDRSGNHCVVKWRYSCSKVLRQSFIDWTFLSLRTSFWAGELYKKLRAKGKTHAVAIRAIAFKWVRIIFRCWKDRTPYSEAKYLKALQSAGSTLICKTT